MKTLLGILLICVGVFIGLYVGVYVFLWGGVISIIKAVTIGSFWLFIWGAIKVFVLASLTGWGLFYLFAFIGASLFD